MQREAFIREETFVTRPVLSRATQGLLALSCLTLSSYTATAGIIDLEFPRTEASIRHIALEPTGPILGQNPPFPGFEVVIDLGSTRSNTRSPVSASGSSPLGSASASSELGVMGAAAKTDTVPDNAGPFTTEGVARAPDFVTIESNSNQAGTVTVRTSLRVKGSVKSPDRKGAPVPIGENIPLPSVGFSFRVQADDGSSLDAPAGTSFTRFIDNVALPVTDFEVCEDSNIGLTPAQCFFGEGYFFTEDTEFMLELIAEFTIGIGEEFLFTAAMGVSTNSEFPGAEIEAEAIFGGFEVGPDFTVSSRDLGDLENRNGRFNYPAAFAALEPDTSVTVPEPATLALFGFGLAGLSFARRRRGNIGDKN